MERIGADRALAEKMKGQTDTQADKKADRKED
jgi:hypothetical protein